MWMRSLSEVLYYFLSSLCTITFRTNICNGRVWHIGRIACFHYLFVLPSSLQNGPFGLVCSLGFTSHINLPEMVLFLFFFSPFFGWSMRNLRLETLLLVNIIVQSCRTWWIDGLILSEAATL